MSQDLMNYDKMTQMALRGVVRDAIRRVIREDGLPGAHHFYISFLTRYPGVDIDASLSDKYPDEITIVLEHQYWDLQAHDEHFEVTLKFGGVPKYISVPYVAIIRFHDPSVSFTMQFDMPEEMAEPQSVRPVARLKPAKKTKSAKKTKPAKAETAKAKVSPIKKPAKKVPTKNTPAPKLAKKPKPAPEGAKVVSLDAFRKK